MSGWLTNGVPELPFVGAGVSTASFDTQAGTSNPETGSLSLLRLATFLNYLSQFASSTPTSGSRYYRQYTIGSQAQLTGIQFLIGATGGTNNVLVELHDSAGNLIATSNTAGVLVGTANTWQQVAFTAPITVQPGTYFLAIQLNGNTARFATYNAAGLVLNVGSATGTFGTGAAITPPTSYTAGVGPVATPY